MPLTCRPRNRAGTSHSHPIRQYRDHARSSTASIRVVMQATLLDEEELQFVGQDLASERVDTLDEALALIRDERAPLASARCVSGAMARRPALPEPLTASGC